MAETSERRRSVLTDEDHTKIGEAFDSRLSTLFETIGYDTSTPESRSEIHKDHTFVRWLRVHKNKFVGAAVVSGGTVIGGAAGGADIILKLFGGG